MKLCPISSYLNRICKFMHLQIKTQDIKTAQVEIWPQPVKKNKSIK